jgi:hypothetical protein
MNTIQKAAAALVLTAAIGVAVYETRRKSLAQQVGELQRRELASADELSRLRKMQSEALRLRGELGQLRRSSSSSSNILARQKTSEPTKPLFPVPFLSFSTKSSSEIKSGETLITGGWPADGGGRTFMLLTLEQPKTTPNEFLSFRTAVFDLTDQMANDMGLTNFVNDASGTTPSGLVDVDETGANAWIAELKSAEGVRVVTTPTVVTKVGDQAEIFAGNSVPVGEGTHARVGRTITLLPSAGPSGIEVSLKTEVTKLAATP